MLNLVSTTPFTITFADDGFRAETRAIEQGSQQLPPSAARRHHFVPAFALAQFARPETRKGWLRQLNLESDRVVRTRPEDVAFGKDLYAYEDRHGAISNTVEAFFSIVEKHAAPALDRLRTDPAQLTPEQREVIAYFLVFQQSRTPGGLARVERVRQITMELQAGVGLSTPHAFKARFGESIAPIKSPGKSKSSA